MAKLVPVDAEERPHLARMKGWLNANDPFFMTIEEIVAERAQQKPRAVDVQQWPAIFSIPAYCRSC